MTNQQGVIQKFMTGLYKNGLKGEKSVDAAVKASSNFKNTQAAITKMVSDCKSTTANNFLKTYCGIDLSNKDTGAITGSDAGGSKVKTAESIVPESGSLDTTFKKNSFKVGNLTVKLATGGGKSGDPVEISFNKLSKQEQYIWQSLHSYWIKGGLDLIAESYGSKYKFTSKPSLDTLYIIFFEDSNNTRRAQTLSGPNSEKQCTFPLELHINMSYYSDITGKNGGTSDGSAWYLDRTIAHELTHALMMENVDYFFYLPQFIAEGTADLVNGIDDKRKSYINALAKDSTLLEKWLDVDDTNSSSNYVYAAGYMFLRYLARQSGDLTLNNTSNKTTLKTFDGNDTISSSGSNVTIDSGAGNDSIDAYGSNLSINGGAGNNYAYLEGSASNVTMKTGSGKDSLHSVAQGATISSGSGDDYIYLYAKASKNKVSTSSGNDSILSAAQVATLTAGAGKDYILLYNNSAKNSVDGGAGNDSIFSGGAGASIVAGDDDDYIHLYTQATKNTVKAGAGDDTIKSYSTSTNYLYGGAGNDSINSGAGADKLYGQSGADALLGGEGDDTLSGGDGNDLLWGGAGTDKLYGGDGDDVFVYQPGEGKDYIYDWESGDMLMILKADGSGGGTYTNSSFKSGNLTLTIDGGGKVIFKDVGSSDTFNINGTTHRISGSKLK